MARNNHANASTAAAEAEMAFPANIGPACMQSQATLVSQLCAQGPYGTALWLARSAAGARYILFVGYL